MAHIPSGAVIRAGIFPEDHPMQLQGTDAFLGNEHQVAYFEPLDKRYFGSLENGVSKEREAVAVLPSTSDILTNPMKRFRRQMVDAILPMTPWALNARWPTRRNQKGFAGIFSGELFVKGVDGFHDSVSLI